MFLMKNQLCDFKKIEREISVFTQPLTISVENVSRADLQLELCDLQSDLFYQGRTETELNFFQVAARRTIPLLAKRRAYTGLNAGKIKVNIDASVSENQHS